MSEVFNFDFPFFQESIRPPFVDLLWNSSYIFKKDCPNWSGYMSLITKSAKFPKSHVSMLPIIDLHVTDLTALYCRLLFGENQCRRLNVEMPCVTYDQQIYVKSYKMNMNIFVRLGGFHQLMSFLGSIGSLMEGSGLRTALETVYAPVTVEHMFTDKGYSRVIRGHLLSASAVLSLIHQEFWNSLYHSEALSNHENHKISTKLLSWFKARRQELSVDSRTSALWLNYVHYVLIVLEFICAERTSNWPLYILATKSMLNLFAATVLTGSIYNLCSVWKRITQTSTNSLFWETIPSGVQAAAVLASGLIFPLNKS